MKFKVGDVCVVIKCDHTEGPGPFPTVGEEVTILGHSIDYGHNYYKIRSDGTYAAEWALRLKEPPEYLRKVSWDSCVWQPKKVRV